MKSKQDIPVSPASQQHARTAAPIARRASAPALTAVCAAAILGGCTSYAPPRFEIVDARVTQRTDQGAIVLLTLEGANSNTEPLPVKEVNYRLSLDGREVFAGRRSAEVTLPKESTRRFELPASVAAADVPAAGGVSRYALNSSITYRLPGAIAETLFDSGLRRPNTAFAAQGDVDFGVIQPALPAPGPDATGAGDGPLESLPPVGESGDRGDR